MDKEDLEKAFKDMYSVLHETFETQKKAFLESPLCIDEKMKERVIEDGIPKEFIIGEDVHLDKEWIELITLFCPIRRIPHTDKSFFIWTPKDLQSLLSFPVVDTKALGFQKGGIDYYKDKATDSIKEQYIFGYRRNF